MSRQSVFCSKCGKLGRWLPIYGAFAHYKLADDRAHLFVPAPLRAPSEKEQDARDEERRHEMVKAGWPGIAIEDRLSGDVDDGEDRGADAI